MPSAFIAAIESADDEAAVERLLQAGAAVDANATDHEFPACVIAARLGHTKVLYHLASLEANLDAVGPNGVSALRAAAAHGHGGAVKCLVESRAEVDAASPEGATALQLAAWHGHDACVNALAQGGADLLRPAPDGSTALHLAAQQGHAACIDVLVAAAEQGSKAHMPVGREALLGARKADGGLSLYCAAQHGQSEAIKALVRHGADARDQGGPGGCSALHIASRSGHAGCVQALTEAGADVHATNAKGESPLAFAAAEGKTKCCRLLLLAGADAEANQLQAAVKIAEDRGHAGTAALLQNPKLAAKWNRVAQIDALLSARLAASAALERKPQPPTAPKEDGEMRRLEAEARELKKRRETAETKLQGVRAEEAKLNREVLAEERERKARRYAAVGQRRKESASARQLELSSKQHRKQSEAEERLEALQKRGAEAAEVNRVAYQAKRERIRADAIAAGRATKQRAKDAEMRRSMAAMTHSQSGRIRSPRPPSTPSGKPGRYGSSPRGLAYRNAGTGPVSRRHRIRARTPGQERERKALSDRIAKEQRAIGKTQEEVERRRARVLALSSARGRARGVGGGSVLAVAAAR